MELDRMITSILDRVSWCIILHELALVGIGVSLRPFSLISPWHHLCYW